MAQIRRRIRYSFAHGAAALAFVAVLLPAASWARGPQETPGVPPGTTLPAQAPEEAGPPSFAGKAFRQGVVAVSHPLAAEAGARILENGGNAVDAVAAIQFALNVVEPQSSGIGGGGFMMIHLAKTNETFIIDSREKAPAAATPDMFGTLSFADASTSGISVGVPGTLRGVATALEKWGTISLAEALKPAIKLADEGFKVGPLLAADIVDTTDRGFPMTNLQPETEAIFRPGGVPLKEGDLLVQRDLAKTFKLIAEQGPDVFYKDKGEIAQAIVDAQMRTLIGPPGVGRMTLADLADYDVAIREPIVGNYRGFTIASMPPPSSGGLTIIQMLKMLERFPLGDTSQGFGFGAKNTLHVMIEAMRLAFADRAFWMGDEDFVPVPKRGLLADGYVQIRSAMINVNSRMPNPTAGNPLPFDTASLPSRKVKLAALGPQAEGVHTTHFAVVDKRGNMVSYTTTVESLFGSGITVPGYGFILNNELTDFNMTTTFNPATGNPGANDVAPFKRPRSSMSPSMLFKDGKPFAAYGASGGATIINGLLQITFNILDHGMTIQEAINAPRISVNSPAGTVSCETGPFFPLPFTPTPPFSLAVLQTLRDMGHNIPACSAIATGASSAAQAVITDLQTGKQYGAADPRREGTVIGLPRPRNLGMYHQRQKDLPSLSSPVSKAQANYPVYADVSP